MARTLIGRLLGLLLLALAAWPPTPAAAHLTPNTLVTLDFRRDVIDAEVLIPLDQLGAAFGRQVDPRRADDQATLRRYFATHVAATAPDGRVWRIAVSRLERTADGYAADLRAMLRLTPPAGGSPRRLSLRYDAVIDRVPNHVVMVLARRDFATGDLGDDPALIGALQSGSRTLLIDRGEGSRRAGFLAAVRLGMHHIAEGHDHLLFLFTLLLAAPLVASGGRWRGSGGLRHTALGLLRVVTAFTIGHSLTLIGGAFLGLRLPAAPVEVMIAVSILISAIHALRPLFPGREALVAGGFGLVHGMAFAAILGAFLFDPWEKAQAILGFNLGIELVQLLVVAAVMPALLILSPSPSYRWLRIGGGLLSATAATAWILQRGFGVLGGAADAIDAMLGHAPWLLLGVLAIACGLTLRRGSAWRPRAVRG